MMSLRGLGRNPTILNQQEHSSAAKRLHGLQRLRCCNVAVCWIGSRWNGSGLLTAVPTQVITVGKQMPQGFYRHTAAPIADETRPRGLALRPHSFSSGIHPGPGTAGAWRLERQKGGRQVCS